jgi:hypothetical protein
MLFGDIQAIDPSRCRNLQRGKIRPLTHPEHSGPVPTAAMLDRYPSRSLDNMRSGQHESPVVHDPNNRP